MRFGDIVKVYWVDAHSLYGWMDKAELKTATEKPLSDCIHVGFFVAKTKTAIIITHGIAAVGLNDGTMEIPLAWVKKTKILERSQITK